MQNICTKKLLFKLLIITSLFAILSCNVGNCYAESVVTFNDYIQTDDCKGRIKQEIIERTTNSTSLFNQDNRKFCIGEPYSIPYYNIPTNKFINSKRINRNVRYSKVYCDKRLVGIIRYMNITDIYNMGIEYFILPDWVGKYYQDIPLFCADWLIDTDGEEVIHYSDNNFICGYINNKSYLLFNGYDKFYRANLSTDFYSVLQIKDNSAYVAEMDKASYKDILFEFEASQISYTNFSSGQYFIKNQNGKALTYADGKYFLSDFTKSKNQIFKISENQDCTYSIIPFLSTKKMSVNGNTRYFISSAYLNENIYQIIDDESQRFLKSTNENDKVFVGSYKYDFSSLWYIEKSEKSKFIKRRINYRIHMTYYNLHQD